MFKWFNHILCALDIHDWEIKPYSKNKNIAARVCANCNKEVILENFPPHKSNDNRRKNEKR